MSGPKISAYEMKRLHLFEEDRRRLLQDLVRFRDCLNRRSRDIENLQRMLLPFYDSKEGKESADALGTIQAAISNSLVRIEKAFQDGTNIALSDALKELKEIHASDEEEVLRIENLVYECREKWIAEKIAKVRIASVGGAESAVGVDSSGGTVFSTKDIIPMETAKGEVLRLINLLEDLCSRAKVLSLECPEIAGYLAQIEEISRDDGRDGFSIFTEIHEIDVKRIRPLREKIENKEREADLLDEQLSRELARYHMLCKAEGIKPKKFAFAKSSIEEIRYECGKILSSRDKDGDLRLLRKQIRETLEKTGYVYLGEKEEDFNFKREVYRIHDDVVLHVIYDSEGKVTMEVAVMDEKDRMPQPREVERIVKEQVKFCTDYEKIFDLINANGLAMKKEAEYPVSPDFAQIINTSEFTCADDADAAKEDLFYEYYQSRELKYL